MTKLDPNKVVNSLTDDSRKKPRKPKRNRTPTGQTHGTTPVGPSPGFPRPGMYENPNNWGSGNYAGGNPGTLPPHSGYMPPTLPPGKYIDRGFFFVKIIENYQQYSHFYSNYVE